MDPQPLLATDSRSLDALRRQAGADPKSAVRAAAGQFESIFMRQVLKSMRDAVPKSGMWEGPAQSTYADMLDQQLSQTLSGRPGGLADVIARQLTRQMGATSPGSARTGAPASVSAVAAAPMSADAALAIEGAQSDALALPASATSAIAAAAVARRASRTAAAAMPPEAVIRQALAAFAATGGLVGAPSGPTSSPGMVAAASAITEAASAASARWVSRPEAASSPAQPDVRHLSGPQADFVRKVWPHALLAERSTGVPAAFIVGQAALESGWGKSEIRNANGTGSFNLFGIKAGGAWRGAATAASTTEFVGGQATRQVARFRSYGSYSEAFQDWAGMMAKSPRYSGVMQSGGSVQAFAASMQRAGYATDPAYGVKLEKTIQKTLSLQRLVT